MMNEAERPSLELGIDNNNYVRLKSIANALYVGSVLVLGSISTIYEYEILSRFTDFKLDNRQTYQFSDVEINGIERLAKIFLPATMFFASWFFITKGAYNAYPRFDEFLNYCMGFHEDISDSSSVASAGNPSFDIPTDIV